MRSLPANVTQDQAIRMFRRRGLSGALHGVLMGRLRSVAEAYLPLHLYEVDIDNRGQRKTSVFGLDAVTGGLDPYHFEHAPGPADTVMVETRNHLLPRLVPAQAEEMLVAKVRRLLYGRGFFRLRAVEIAARFLPGEIYIPYWLGFYGSETSVRLAVVDAVRRSREGAKARHVFESWLGENGK